MTEDLSYYTPERIDTILRNWPRYQSQAEGCRSSAPDALRPARGKRSDQLASADTVADIEVAIVMTLPRWSLAWQTVDHVQRCFSLTQVASTLHIRKEDVLHAYDEATKSLAIYLGWEEETV